MISTPSGDWKIAEACSGIRYLTSSIVIGILFAGVALRSWKRRLALVSISPLVPILANAVRAYLIILLAYFSNNRIAAGVDHVMYGWLFFSLVTAIMIGVALRWREPEISPIRVASMCRAKSSTAGAAAHPAALLHGCSNLNRAVRDFDGRRPVVAHATESADSSILVGAGGMASHSRRGSRLGTTF